WAEAEGATVEPRLEPETRRPGDPQPSDVGLRLGAGKRLSGPSMLLEVPRALWIEASGADGEEAEWKLALSLAAERAKGAESFWAPYVATLPTAPSSALALRLGDAQAVAQGLEKR
ncbi:unnamed protein product, partial [Polarella glacialis]